MLFRSLAELPAKVTFPQAATFPVAGLTALLALANGGLLLGLWKSRTKTSCFSFFRIADS